MFSENVIISKYFKGILMVIFVKQKDKVEKSKFQPLLQS